jgi:hypothetical protein
MSLERTAILKKSTGNYYLPSATVSFSRVPIFAPVTRISPYEIKKTKLDNPRGTKPISFVTPYGTCSTIQRTRLTQIHRDIVEAILTFHIEASVSGNGDVAFLIKPYELMKKMSSTCNMTWFKQHLEDMRGTQLILKENDWTVHVGIVLRYKYLEDTKNTDSTKYGNGKLFAVQFSAEFMRSFGLELNVHYPMLVDDILAIDSPLIRATVRFFLTHNSFSIGIDKVFLTLGLSEISKRAKLMKMEEFRKNSEILERFGITIKGDNFIYTKHKLVGFSKPGVRKSHTTESEVITSGAEVPCHGSGSHNLGAVEYI